MRLVVHCSSQLNICLSNAVQASLLSAPCARLTGNDAGQVLGCDHLGVCACLDCCAYRLCPLGMHLVLAPTLRDRGSRQLSGIAARYSRQKTSCQTPNGKTA